MCKPHADGAAAADMLAGDRAAPIPGAATGGATIHPSYHQPRQPRQCNPQEAPTAFFTLGFPTECTLPDAMCVCR